MATLLFKYTFAFQDGRREVFELCLDSETLEPVDEPIGELPEWTRLAFHQCEHCPLRPETHPRCPLAVRLVDLVHRFEDVLSYEGIHVQVETAERTVTKSTSAQVAISSLMGLVMATSGCPHTAIFKPMARFHLPLSTAQETMYRVASMYLLAQYFTKRAGGRADLELDGLRELYQCVEVLNRHMAERIRGAITKDAALNALIMLDFFVKNLFFRIDTHLEDTAHLFEPYLASPKN